MLSKETQWKRAERINLAIGTVGVLVILVDLIWDPMPEGAMRGGGIGLLSASIMLYFVLYRRHGEKLSPVEQEVLVERELSNNRILFWCLAGVATSIGALVLFDDNETVLFAFGAILAVLCVVVFVVAARSLWVARASRSNPGLFDERAEGRFQKANAAGFTWMLNAALLGGAAHFIFELDIPTWLAFYGPAFVGVLGMLWVMSRDDEAA